MPSWRSKLTQDQIWQLAAYVRSLVGLEPMDAVSARADSMSNTPPQTADRAAGVTKSADPIRNDAAEPASLRRSCCR